VQRQNHPEFRKDHCNWKVPFQTATSAKQEFCIIILLHIRNVREKEQLELRFD